MSFAPNASTLRKPLGAVAVNLIRARDAAAAGCLKTLALTARTNPSGSAHSHLAVVLAAGLALLVRSADQEEQDVVARALEAHLPFRGWAIESRPTCLAYHRDDPASIANRLVFRDLLHFGALYRSRNVVLSGLLRRGFLGEIIEHVLRQPRR